MKFKYTLIGQLLSLIKSHAVTGLVFALVWTMMLSLWATSVGEYIFAIFGTICYAISMYNAGFAICEGDKKTFSRQEPRLFKCIILTALLVIANILIIMIYKLSWELGGNGTSLTSGWAIAGNLISIVWFSFFGRFMGMVKGTVELAGCIVMVLVPMIASALGYAASFYGLDIGGKINAFMYEKQKSKK